MNRTAALRHPGGVPGQRGRAGRRESRAPSSWSRAASIIWGRLRGAVHAGSGGDADAVVCSLEIAPMRLQIADQVCGAEPTGDLESTPGHGTHSRWRHCDRSMAARGNGTSMTAQVITLSSGKGGVGKTTAVANIAVALAADGVKVVCIDGDIGLRNLDVVLGLENRIVYDIVDVIEGRCKLRQAMIRDKHLPSCT